MTKSLSAAEQHRERRLTITVNHDTNHYHSANETLPWYQRLLVRSSLTLFHSFLPSLLSVLTFYGEMAVVSALTSEAMDKPAKRMAVWFILGTFSIEVGVDIMRGSVEPDFLRKKPLYCIILTAVWTAFLVSTGGNLGMWSFAVFWFAWFACKVISDFVNGGHEVVTTLANATLISTIFLMEVLLVSSYSYVVSTVEDPMLLVVLTGGIYPVLSHGMKELIFDHSSKDMDKDAGLSNKDVENGTFIMTVVHMEAVLDYGNKIAIVQIANPYGFAGSVVSSLIFEVATKMVSLAWHRKKAALARRVNSASMVAPKESTEETTDAPETSVAEQAPRSFRKAVHRHNNANDRKRYEFRTYYEELGESVATTVAFSYRISLGDVQLAEGLGRLLFALLCEYLADLSVWWILEWDGYMLANVVYQFSFAWLGQLVVFVVGAMVAVEIGNEMAAMAKLNVLMSNGTANGTVGNMTA